MSQDRVCGRDGNACETPLGTYRIALPDGEGPLPALLFFHGAGGSGLRTLQNETMVSAFIERGYAVIAPDGLPRPNSRFGPGWSFLPQRPAQRDEWAFADEVMDDVATRFGVDRSRIMAGGFSIGGSLTWYLACKDPALAAAYVPVAGAFWRPHPSVEDCAGPVKLLHTHGWRDTVVPLEGRPLRNGEIYQGDVYAGMEVMRALNGCKGMRADAFDTDDTYWIRWWTRCDDDTALRFALHPGPHSVPRGWATMAIDWFETLELD